MKLSQLLSEIVLIHTHYALSQGAGLPKWNLSFGMFSSLLSHKRTKSLRRLRNLSNKLKLSDRNVKRVMSRDCHVINYRPKMNLNMPLNHHHHKKKIKPIHTMFLSYLNSSCQFQYGSVKISPNSDQNCYLCKKSS